MKFINLHSHTSFSIGDGFNYPKDHFDFIIKNAESESMGYAISDHGNANSFGYAFEAQKQLHKKGIDFKFIPGCLLKGQEIVEKKGIENIENINPGDFVLTHRGRFRKVLKTSVRPYKGKIYSIYLNNRYSRPLTLTEEHPVLIRNQEGEIDWVLAKDLIGGRKFTRGLENWNSYVCLPKIKPEFLQEEIQLINFLPKEFLIKEDYITKDNSVINENYNRLFEWKNIKNEQKLDEDFVYMLGLFCAEGHVKSCLDGSFGFTFHEKEKEYISFIISFFKERFGLEGQTYSKKDNHSFHIEFCCLPLAHFLMKSCGQDCYTKKIPDFVFDQSNDIIKKFIDGVVDGDGKTKNKKSTKQDLKVASKKLAWGIRTLLSNFGCFNSVSSYRHDQKQSYQVCVDFDCKHRILEDENYLFKPILKIESVDFDGNVYNCEVEEDNSYVSDFVLHNCEFYYHPNLEDWQKIYNAKKEGTEENLDDGLIIEIENESKGKYYDPIKRRHHLVVLAYNQIGLRNLYRLVSRSYRYGFYRYPRIDNRMLEECNEGLVISTACIHPDAELHTSEGTLTIKEVVEKVSRGEEIQVLGYNEEKDSPEFKKVNWGDKTRKNAKLLRIKTKDGKELKLTPDHKVFTDRGWIEAQHLQKGLIVRIIFLSREKMEVITMKLIEIESIEEIEETSDVYDIEVDEIHNFFANGILVHNCIAGLPSWITLRDYEDKSQEEIFKSLDNEFKPLLDIFGKDRAHLEIQFNKLPEQRIVNDVLIKYSQHSGYPLLATADSHYCKPDFWKDRELYRMLAWQSKGRQISASELPETIDDLKCELYPKNGNQMFEAYRKMYGDDISEELDETVKNSIKRGWDIGNDLCEFIGPDKKIKLPKRTTKSKTSYDHLEEIVYKKFDKRWFKDNQKYIDRLKFELSVIKDKNFADYFVTLYDAMTEIKKHQLSSPGRGSGCGSLVLYVLDITQLDPIKNNLLFERFLSPHRTEPPDVDLDSDNREKSLEILKGLFGENEVIPITNYNTLQLKSLVKDISKLYEIPFSDVNDVTRAIEPEAKQAILDDAGGDQKLVEYNYKNVMKHSPTFRKFIEDYPMVGEHIENLYGQIKSIGKHAGGVAITDNSEEAMPVIRSKGIDQTPWTEGLAAKHLEPAGIIKYDFLAIETLGFIRQCIETILREKLDREPSFEEVNEFYIQNLHPDNVGDGDLDVFEEVYHKGKFPGIFQFTEDTAQKVCSASKPEKVMDLAVITSIVRPGPLKGKVDEKYIRSVNYPEEIEFSHPILEEILGETNGYIVFQEQFMLLAHKLAGFTLEEANKLRKLLVKPITSMGEEMKKQRIEVGEKFIEGCVEKGLSEERARSLWEDEILGFISYGFNKSHALAYSYVSYQCAWLYHHYPDKWVCAYLENDPDRDKAISDVESVGYKIGKNDILKSSKNWTIDNDNILIPSFSTLKGIGDIAVEELLEIRKDWKIPDVKSIEQEAFKEIFDSFFYEYKIVQQKRGPKEKRFWKFSKFNKRAIEALIKVEGFDSLGIVGEGRLFENYAHMYRALIENWSKRDRQNFNILDIARAVDKVDWDVGEKIEFQKDIIGTYDKTLLISEYEIEELKDLEIFPISEIESIPRSHWFILEDFKIKKTRYDKRYYKLFVSDLSQNKKTINYFNKPKSPFKRKSIYAANLFQNGNWINIAKGSYIIRVK